MADTKISLLNSLTKSTIDTADVLPVVDTSASETKKITYQELIQPLDSQFAIADNSDTTKKVNFQVSGVTTGNTRTLTVPDASTTIVGTDTTQTLSAKTLTAPQINFGSDANGDLIIRNGSGVTSRLAPGTSGQILNIDSGTGLPTWVANPSAADASTTTKGVSEEATQAEVDAGTTAGGTSARLFQNPSTIRARLLNTGVADTGSANAVAIAPSPAITAYAAYQEFTFKAAATNTGATTINVNALGTKNIYKNGTSALSGGEIIVGGVYTVVYDGTQFQLVNTTSLLTNTVNADEGISNWYTTAIPFYVYVESGPAYKSVGWTPTGYMTLGSSYRGAGLADLSLSNNGGTLSDPLPGPLGGSTLFKFSNAKKWKIKFYAFISNSTTVWSLGIVDSATYSKMYTAQTDTTASQMRIVWNSSSIYLANSNGTNYTATSISGITRTNWNLYELAFDGTNLYCYVNGVLKATNSTYIPTSSNDCYLVVGGDAMNQYMRTSPLTFSMEL